MTPTDEKELEIPVKNPIPDTPCKKEKEEEDGIVKKIEDKAKAFVKSDKIRDAQSPSEFVTKNMMRLIEKTYWFMAFLVGLYVIVVAIRPELADKVLTVFALVLGGVLGLIGNNILGNKQQQNT